MVVSVHRETEEMTRAFKDFVSDVGASVRSMTPSKVRSKMEEYSETMSSMSSLPGSSAMMGMGGGAGGAAGVTSPRSSSLLDSMKCGAMGANLECSALGDNDASPMDWTTGGGDDATSRRRNGSDWTVQVYDGKESVVYRVHTVALSYGPRSSNYFARLFEKKRMAAAPPPLSPGGRTPSKRNRSGLSGSGSSAGGVPEEDAVTEVYLPGPAASAFPLLLDYIYHDRLPTGGLDATNAPSLRHLSKYFSVQSLFETVGSFIKSDLTAETAPEYCVAADAVMDKELVDAAMRKCADNLLLSPNGKAAVVQVEKLSPKLMGEFLTSRHVKANKRRCHPERMSEIVCHYIRANRNERLGDESFYYLTQPSVLPVISPSEAVFLLSYGQKYPAALHEGGDVSLKRRCMDALARDWDAGLGDAVEASAMEREGRRDPSPSLFEEEEENNNGDTGGRNGRTQADTAMRYRNLPLEVRVELLETALLCARKDRRQCDGTTNDAMMPPPSSSAAAAATSTRTMGASSSSAAAAAAPRRSPGRPQYHNII